MLIHFLKFIPFTNTARMRRLIIQKKWEEITRIYERKYIFNSKKPNVLILFYSARAYTNLKQKKNAYEIWKSILWYKNARFQRARLAMELEGKDALYEILIRDIRDGIQNANEHFLEYIGKYEMRRPEERSDLKNISDFKWEDIEFKQNGRLVKMHSPCGVISWIMPEDYSLKNTHEDLLRVCAHILLRPMNKDLLDDWTPTRTPGTRPGLALSCGIDSVAALLLMPENTVALHHRRPFKSMLKHSNADITLNALKKMNKWTINSIISDHEVLRTSMNKPIGFSTDFATCAHLILLADYYDLDSIAMGMPIDNTYLRKGAQFRNFEQEKFVWRYWSRIFDSIGLSYNSPLAGVSQAGALKIVKSSGLDKYVNSCLRGKDGNGCGTCWKCFHKNGVLGRPFDATAGEINVFLQKRPLNTAVHVTWVIQKFDLFELVPDLKYLKTLDLSWWENYYPPALELLPKKYREQQKNAIEQYLKPMPKPYAIENIHLFKDTEIKSPENLIKNKRKNTIVVFPTNGVGFGHFTRVLSIAKRIKEINSEVEIIFFTTMTTLHILKEQGGFVAYHMPGRKKFENMDPKTWNILCEEFLEYIFKHHKPNYFIFDGVFPYRGMLNSISNHKEITTFWIKRYCLKESNSKKSIEDFNQFDYIIRPNDSIKLDLNKRNNNLITCNPILLLENNELMDRKDACIRLGIPEDAIIVYIQLGAGNINDINSEINITLDALNNYENIFIVLGESMIGERLNITRERVRIIRDYPNSIYFKAFDFAIMAAGYNSFHEAIQFSLPTIFYPNLSTKQDDQLSRAKIAEEVGSMIVLEKRNRKNISNAIKILYDEKVRKKMRENTKCLQKENGAKQIAKILIKMIDET